MIAGHLLLIPTALMGSDGCFLPTQADCRKSGSGCDALHLKCSRGVGAPQEVLQAPHQGSGPADGIAGCAGSAVAFQTIQNVCSKPSCSREKEVFVVDPVIVILRTESKAVNVTHGVKRNRRKRLRTSACRTSGCLVMAEHLA